jgi:hypothetical protein
VKCSGPRAAQSKVEAGSGCYPQFSFEHIQENPFPAFLLLRNRLVRLQALFQAQARRGFAKPQDTPTVGELKQKHFNAALHIHILVLESEFRQHLVKAFRCSAAQAGMQRARCPFELCFVEFKDGFGRIVCSYCSRL